MEATEEEQTGLPGLHHTNVAHRDLVCEFNRPVSGLMVCILFGCLTVSLPATLQLSQWSKRSHQSPLRGQRQIDPCGFTDFPIIFPAVLDEPVMGST